MVPQYGSAAFCSEKGCSECQILYQAPTPNLTLNGWRLYVLNQDHVYTRPKDPAPQDLRTPEVHISAGDKRETGDIIKCLVGESKHSKWRQQKALPLSLQTSLARNAAREKKLEGNRRQPTELSSHKVTGFSPSPAVKVRCINWKEFSKNTHSHTQSFPCRGNCERHRSAIHSRSGLVNLFMES